MSFHRVVDANTDNHYQPKWKAEWTISRYFVAVVEGQQTVFKELTPDSALFDYPNHMAVQVNSSSHNNFRYHRFSPGTILANGRFIASISPRVTGWKEGKPDVDAGYWDAFFKLMEHCEKWQLEDADEQTAAYQAKSQNRQREVTQVLHKVNRAPAYRVEEE